MGETTGAGGGRGGRSSDASVRRELTEHLLVLFQQIRHYVKEQAADLGLSLLQARVLGLLSQATTSARELADQLKLDPSNITSVVDRLEEAGLLRRELQVGDRRVKLLVLTDAGRDMANELRARLVERNPVGDALSLDQQRQLTELLDVALRQHAAR